MSPAEIAGSIDPVRTMRAFTKPDADKTEKVIKTALRVYPSTLKKSLIRRLRRAFLLIIRSGGACTNIDGLLGTTSEGVIRTVLSPWAFETVKRIFESGNKDSPCTHISSASDSPKSRREFTSLFMRYVERL